MLDALPGVASAPPGDERRSSRIEFLRLLPEEIRPFGFNLTFDILAGEIDNRLSGEEMPPPVVYLFNG